MKKLLRPFYRVMASVQLGVILLILIAVVLAVATRIEAGTSSHLVRVFVYESAWFDALLALFGLNILLATLDRRPFRLHHTGMLLTHLSLLLILAGGLLTRHFAVDGFIQLEEGQTRDAVQLREFDLCYRDTAQDAPVVLLSGFERRSSSDDLQLKCDTPSGESLLVTAWYTDAERSESVRPADNSGTPALKYTLSTEDFRDTQWLWSAEPMRSYQQYGDLLRIEFAAGLDSAAVAAQFAQSEDLQMSFRWRGKEHTVPVAVGEYALNKSTQLVFERTFSSFFIDEEGQFQDRGGEARNPAVLFWVRGADGEDRYLSFLNLPGFDPLNGREAANTALEDIQWQGQPGGGATASGQVLLVYHADALTAYWQTGDKLEPQPVAPGVSRLLLPWMNLELTVDEYLPRAERRVTMRNRSHDLANPALAVREGHGAQDWLGLGFWQPLSGGGQIALLPRLVELGFRVTLEDFREDTYPGSAMAAAYSSLLLLDDGGGQTRSALVEMNKPVKHRGFRFFQSGFQRNGGQESSTLQVSRDPGQNAVFAGFTLLMAGLIIVFYFKRPMQAVAKRNSRKEKES